MVVSAGEFDSLFAELGSVGQQAIEEARRENLIALQALASYRPGLKVRVSVYTHDSQRVLAYGNIWEHLAPSGSPRWR